MLAVVMVVVAIVFAIGGILLLRLKWSRNGSGGPVLAYAGWSVSVASLILMGYAVGFEVGIPYALVALMIAGLALVGSGLRLIEKRRSPAQADRGERLEPEIRPKRQLRAALRGLLAIPVAGIAALGLGVVLATNLPFEDIDRLAIGGLTIPMTWGAGMTWALADPTVLRPGLGLVILVGLSGLVIFA